MSKHDNVIVNNGQLGFFFFIAYLGAAVYFVQQAHGFWEVIGALFKAIVWPGFVASHVLRLFQA